jgi:myo-inositol-1(or 4)-monophosphatase
MLKERLNFIKELAIEVGNITLKGFGHCQHIEKPNQYGYDILTEYDTTAENLITKAIQEKYEEAIISEESGLIGDSEQAKKNVWIVDPIDGTLNFQRGIPLYGISIAYCKNGIPVVGVIYLPALGELFFAGKGIGAFIHNTRTQKDQLILVDKEKDVRKLIIAMEGQEALQKIIPSYFQAGFSHRSLQLFRCAVFTLAYLAYGKIHFYFNSLINLWDCAAGEILIQEAGGLPCVDKRLIPIFPNSLNDYLDLDIQQRKAFRLNLVAVSNDVILTTFFEKVVKPTILLKTT